MKILPPTLREKKRYIVFELISENSINRKDLIYEIFSCASSLIGDVSASECSIRLLVFKNSLNQKSKIFSNSHSGFKSSKGIIRCAHDKIDETRSILATIAFINGKKCLIHVIGVSGTVLGAKNKHLYKLNKFTRN
ncbi:MAG: ribonuclease P [Methanosarcinales archaeon]|jgi:ribonuclease P/MRP protein subunit POP5|nr:ribonuclease P [Methanosarcinales archaeon]